LQDSGSVFSPLLARRVSFDGHARLRAGHRGKLDRLQGGRDVDIGARWRFEYVRAGKLRALAATASTPSPVLTDIPTVAEFVPGYEASFWTGAVVLAAGVLVLGIGLVRRPAPLALARNLLERRFPPNARWRMPARRSATAGNFGTPQIVCREKSQAEKRTRILFVASLRTVPWPPLFQG